MSQWTEVNIESKEDMERASEASKPSNSEAATRGNLEQFAPSGIVNLKLVEALSEAPYSPLFGILWPIIIEQASFETRNLLRKVNTYFERLCYPHDLSDLAKHDYVLHNGNREHREDLPVYLDLSFGVEWRCWCADKCWFHSAEGFRAFCALGDIDPDKWHRWEPDASLTSSTASGFTREPYYRHIWMSRTKDIVVETVLNPVKDFPGSCHCLGLTGVADKAIAMYNFMHDNYSYEEGEPEDGPAMTTMWECLGWDRGII